MIALGKTHSVKEFLEKVFQKLELDYTKYVEIDSRYFRPTDVNVLLGNSSKARRVLGWKPRVTFDGLVEMMVESDVETAKKENAA